MPARLAIVALLLASAARAQAQACDPAERDCGCEPNWGCWDLLYTSPGTILGVRGTRTVVRGSDDSLDAGASTVYSLEHFGTRRGLAAHARLLAAIGGGTAGTEGELRGDLDVGLRASVTDTSGPFLRVGPSGALFGNDRLHLSHVEPLAVRIGFQQLDGPVLFELATTGGWVLAGRYAPAEEPGRDLHGVAAIGGYLAMHLTATRVEVSLLHMPAMWRSARVTVDIARLSACVYAGAVAGCADVASVRAVDAGRRMARAVYGGLTFGLTP